MAVHPLPSPEILERQAWQIPEKVNIAKSILMIFGLGWFAGTSRAERDWLIN